MKSNLLLTVPIRYFHCGLFYLSSVCLRPLVRFVYDRIALWPSSWLSTCAINEPHHEKTCLWHMPTAKAQISLRARPRSLISAFVIRCWDGIIPLVSIPKTSSLQLASVTVQVGLSLTLSQTPEDRFSRNVAHSCPVLMKFNCIGSFSLSFHLLFRHITPFILPNPVFKAFSTHTFTKQWHEPPHDKTNKITVRPAKTQISLDIRPVRSGSSLSARRKIGSLATHWAHSDD